MTTLEQKIEAMEHEIGSLRRKVDRGRWTARALGGAAGLSVLLAAAGQLDVPEVIRARRFEVLDAQNKPVVALSNRDGGHVDVFAASGHHVIGLSSNPFGGDVALWNLAGHNVAGLYTTEQGGATTVYNAQGQSVNSLRAEADGCGRLEVANSAGNVVFTVDGVPESGATLGLLNQAGRKMFAVATPSAGALVNMMTGDGRVILAAGASADGTGGVLQLRNDFNKPIVELGVNPDQGGAVSVFDADGKLRQSLAPPSAARTGANDSSAPR